MTNEPAIAGANAPARHKPPDRDKNTPAAMIERLIVELIKEARRQLAILSNSKTGGDVGIDNVDKENVKLRAANARTLASIVEIVRQIAELQLLLEQMGSVKSARKAGIARESLQRKMARLASDLRVRGILGRPDG